MSPEVAVEDGDADADPEADTEPDADADPDPDGDADPDADPDAEPDAEPEDAAGVVGPAAEAEPATSNTISSGSARLTYFPAGWALADMRTFSE
jgi:hypothetical protein